MKTESVTTLKRQANRLISEIRKSKTPVLITEDGHPAAYLMDAETFELQQARLRILEGIARGERAVEEGRTLTHAQARRRMRKWLS